MKLRCIVLIMVGILFLSGCRTKIQSVAIESRTDSIYIDKLIPYPMPIDSASIRALMECDENGKVVLRWLDIANTKNVQLQFVIDSLGQVIADMKVKPDTLYLPSKEIYVDRKIDVPVEVERKHTKWEQFKMDVGGWAIGVLSGLLLLGIGYVIVWLIKKRR
ncbi:hypothetical protein [Parabacteroides distasonis]|uniref:hypothetical protein n=1 Tax=Parabacteroides distasonis TaxID=823 RepID=UPI001F22C3E3|nr:hypothetical protein [Parabacteroides distasonis]MCE9038883.1 hypothetical protein [Parabacteroides distasonis]